MTESYKVVFSYAGDHQESLSENVAYAEAVNIFNSSIEKLKANEDAEFIEIWKMDANDNLIDTVLEHGFED